MKQSTFATIVIVVGLLIGLSIWQFIFGDPSNFYDTTNRQKPLNLMGIIYVGGLIAVPFLIGLSIVVVTFTIERALSLRKAQGRGTLLPFLKSVQRDLSSGDVEAALQKCHNHRGSMANIIRAGLERYQAYLKEDVDLDHEKKMSEVQRSIEEATALEMPFLERNLIILSTIASIATMLGLLGTTIGMIRAFRALAQTGAPDAVQLSIGISEALVNTALGIMVAVMGIVTYNFFVNKVDTFTYMIDEASYDVIQTLSVKSKSK